jgi:hypothetical protein
VHLTLRWNIARARSRKLYIATARLSAEAGWLPVLKLFRRRLPAAQLRS